MIFKETRTIMKVRNAGLFMNWLITRNRAFTIIVIEGISLERNILKYIISYFTKLTWKNIRAELTLKWRSWNSLDVVSILFNFSVNVFLSFSSFSVLLWFSTFFCSTLKLFSTLSNQWSSSAFFHWSTLKAEWVMDFYRAFWKDNCSYEGILVILRHINPPARAYISANLQ